MPESMGIFRAKRPEDINIESGVAAQNGMMKYYIFNDGALNTFDSERALELDAIPKFRIDRVVDIQVRTLSDIFEKHLPEGREIDFLTIDVEGLDSEVIQSNNWSRFRPKIVILNRT